MKILTLGFAALSISSFHVATARQTAKQNDALLVIFRQPISCEQANHALKLNQVHVNCQHATTEAKLRKTFSAKYYGKAPLEQMLAEFKTSSFIEHMEIDEE